MLVVVGAAVAASLAWLLWRRGVGAALAVGVLAYPFILSLAPASVAWKAGRYTNFLVPLLVLLVAAMFGDRSSRRANVANDRRERRVRPRTLFLLSALTACLVAASVVAFEDLRTINVLPGSRAGPTANQPAEALASALGGVGIRGGYADYWVAYKLDFLAPGRLELTDTPPSPDRLPSVRTAVRALPARRQAWIFVKPTPTARTEYADTSIIRGPSGLQLTSFLSDLDRLGIAHRVLHLSGADAVVCVRPVTPAEVGLRFAAVGS